MNFLFESRFSALMEGISGQFGTSPLGLLFFFLALAALPLFLLFLYHLQKHREKQARLQWNRKIVQKRCEKIGLSPSEKRLVERLSEYAGEAESAYLVIFDEPRFNKAAAALLKKDAEVSPGSIAALRIKLGFSGEASRRLHSTAQMQMGARLLVRPRKKKGVFRAVITALKTDGFEITMDGNNLLATGDSALFQYQNSQGTFLFKSYCTQRRGRRMLIRHQEKLKQLQKRAYFRAAYTGRVEAGYFDTEERYQTRCIDLGGGGASLINPEDRFTQGDFLELIFSLPGSTDPLHLKGSVLRVSRGKRRLHVRFEGIQEKQRDRIFKMVFKPHRNSG